MKRFRHLLYVMVLLWILAQLGCDGDTYAGGGIGGTGRTTSSGAVTGIGSVFVNGVRYDTRDAEIYVDGELRGQGDDAVINNLDIGRVVRVDGVVTAAAEGTATKVTYAATLVGPVDRIEAIDGHDTLLSILGQEVVVNEATAWKGVSPGRLAPGNLVEISGFIDDAAVIQAAFLLKLADTVASGDLIQVTGQVSGLEPAQTYFAIKDLMVHYDQADLTDLAPGGLADGIWVAVSGQWQGTGAEISADIIQRHRRLGDSTEGRIELEGFVKLDETTRQFSLEGYNFETQPTTTYVGGTAEDLIAGVRIELEGELEQGVIVADKVTFWRKFRAEADLFRIDAGASTLELAGLGNITIQTNDITRFSGQADGFNQLAVGNHLIIKGRLVDEQTALASHVIVLLQGRDKVVLRGTVLNINAPELSINGVVIDTNTIPADGFSLGDNGPVSQDRFLAAIQQDDWLQARGQLLPGNQIDWSAITLIAE